MKKLTYILLQPPIYITIIVIMLFVSMKIVSTSDNGKIQTVDNQENMLNEYNDLPNW